MNGFDFGSANNAQRNAITSTEGPILITAGPGTGKTFTLVKRVSFLIQEQHVDPSNILVATFTEKAAKELVTRISNELSANGVEFDVNEMYVGTFHSICLRLIKEHIEYSNVRKNYRVADSFDQQYLVYQNYWSRACGIRASRSAASPTRCLRSSSTLMRCSRAMTPSRSLMPR